MKTYAAEIISIGNEVLAGYTVNTNASFIAQQLLTIGLPVQWIITVRDDHTEIIQALQSAAQRADAVLVTGGLGPTPDDITKQALCDYFGVKMRRDEQVLTSVKTFLSQRNIKYTATNLQQALIPDCDTLFPNRLGTAPGLGFERNGTHFFFMPGVPAEMKSLVKHSILDYLKNKLPLSPVHNRLLRTTGIPESYLYDRIADLLRQYPQIQFASLPRQIGVDLRFRLVGRPDKEGAQLERLIAGVKKIAGKFIFTDEEIELEEALGRLLTQKQLTLAAAESFTGGLVQDKITDIAGSSAYFLGGMVTYSNMAKIKFLRVREETLKNSGAVSAQTALEMVRGVQKRFGSNCALATTGIAGPGGATITKAVGLCFIAARYGRKEMVKEFHFGTVRRLNKERGAMAAMEMLRRLILGIQ